MSSIRFQHKQFYDASEQLDGMRWLKKTIKDEKFDGIAFALAQPYSRLVLLSRGKSLLESWVTTFLPD